jgi:hypothetical protein
MIYVNLCFLRLGTIASAAIAEGYNEFASHKALISATIYVQ